MLSPSFEALGAAALLLFVVLVLACVLSWAVIRQDIRTRTIPTKLCGIFFAVSAGALTGVAALTGDWEPLIRAGVGAVGLFAVYLTMAVVRPGGLGGGDIKLAPFVGLLLGWFGWTALGVGAFAAFVIAAVVVSYRVWRKTAADRTIAFGPFMIAGLWVGIAVSGLLA